MGASEDAPVVEVMERNREGEDKEEEEEKKNNKFENEEKEEDGGVVRDTEIGTFQEHGNTRGFNVPKLQTLNPTNPLRIVIQGASPAPPPQYHHPPQQQQPQQQHQQRGHPSLSVSPTPQQYVTTLNSRAYTNKISLFVFLVHIIAAAGLVCFLIFKAVELMIHEGEGNKNRRREKRILEYWLPQVEAATILSIILALAWQKAVRVWPEFMVRFILWSSFFANLAAGILLLCFQRPSTEAVGVCLVAFAIGNGLYASWVNQRIKFTGKVISKALEPVGKFGDLNQPTYIMLGTGFMWISLWVVAIIGALNFYLPALVVTGLVLSLAWTAEVLRNVANLTVSRAIGLYYLRGMQSSTKFCFQRALSRNLGSACLGSLFVPGIEALRIIARGLNLLEGEDEFMFSCAHCCLKVMESIFRYGNGWAFVQIAAYGKGFVQASEDTWGLFERQGMATIVDSDITSSICFLSGVCSGSLCVIATASWTAAVQKTHTATVSLLAFFIGYLLVGGHIILDSYPTRIAMALPHACVSSYYVCYAENPENRLFDKTIPDRINYINSGRDAVVPTPRVPRRFRT